MVFVKATFGYGGREDVGFRCHAECSGNWLAHSRLELVHISGHELDVSVGKGLARLVVERYPADDIEQVAADGRDDVVVGVPAHAAGHVTEFCIGGSWAVALQQPGESRFQN